MATSGGLWVAAGDWRIISATGEPVGAVALPVSFRPLEADGDRIWGTDFDELDVPYIVRYRLTGG